MAVPILLLLIPLPALSVYRKTHRETEETQRDVFGDNNPFS
jgi:hypothetical protein